ncbi:MAG: NADH:flavin oxidoreductase [Thermodesulfobacteriota bacterium]|nr:NADH:flavin oxidoreductase [Thermodesulfobacteriota bacterium]
MTINLFEPYRISNMELKNRFVRSATWDATADSSGAVTASSAALYKKLGQGGVGLIISGYAFVSSLGQAINGQYGVHTDNMIFGLRKMVQAAHEGGAKIALQIVHAGINSHYLPQKGITNLAVSNVLHVKNPHREMTDEEIESIISDFASAALRAKEAGFDAVQLHGAHGYLMSQFLSPLFNLRTDRWGGSSENRRRFHLEVVEKVRQKVGNDFPLLIKLGMQDDDEEGLVLNEALEATRLIVERGIDSIEISGGFGGSIRAREEGDPEQPYFREQAAAVKRMVSVPVILVGGIRSLQVAQNILNSNDADLISMCRPFIREPDLITRWQKGDKNPARCISCNKCFGILMKGEPLECALEKIKKD